MGRCEQRKVTGSCGWRAPAMMVTALLAHGCAPEIVSGRFHCDASDGGPSSQCPPGWYCLDPDGNGSRCFQLHCGNGAIDPGEACDGAALAGRSCLNDGYSGGGLLRCSSDCRSFDHSGCAGYCGEDVGTRGRPCCAGSACARGLVCAGGACVYDQGNLGQSCRTDVKCPFCRPIGGVPKCTSACTATADCLSGWSCDPAARLCQCFPSSEVCDGKDNDCNGIIDDPGPSNAACVAASMLPSTCQQGACVCSGTGLACGVLCVDEMVDHLHCGRCDNACPWDATCLTGQCVCPMGTMLCPGACADLTSDPLNCGACGVRCAPFAPCLSGRCGPLTEGVTYTIPTYFNSASNVVADFDQDGKPDIAVTTYFSYQGVVVFLGRGDGTFPLAVSSRFPVYASSFLLAQSDFNGDGLPDLAVAGQYSGDLGVYIVPGTGRGTFGVKAGPVDFSHDSTTSLVVGDWNGDKRSDLALMRSSGSSVTELMGRGDGSFEKGVSYPVNGDSNSVLESGDLNGDPYPDLVVAGTLDLMGNPSVSVLLGGKDGRFAAAVDYPVGHDLSGVALADFDGDGHVDIAVNTWDNTVSVLPGRGDGTFGRSKDSPAGDCCGSFAKGDFNHDGKPDVVVVGVATNILLGIGDGTFQAPLVYRQFAWYPVISDLNLDHKDDLAGQGLSPGGMTVFLNVSP